MRPPTEATARLTVDQLISTTTLDWDKERLNQILPELTDEILEIKPSSLGAEDAYVWLATKNGIYTAKSGYYSCVNE